jgi:hypothetical protein
MIPERSIQGKFAKSVFFEEINDIDIFIEDTAYGYEKIFTVLFSRVFEGTYRVNKVFQLGGRNIVIGQHKSNINNASRPTLYVIDSDLFILTGDNVFNTNGLFKLPCYCVENIICDPEAIHILLDEEETSKSKDEVVKEFNYNEWLNRNIDQLFELFIEYAIVFKVKPSEQTVAFPVNKLVSGDTGNIDANKLGNRISNLNNMLIDLVGIEQYSKYREQVLQQYKTSGLSKLDVISGKDYIFPLLKTRFRSTVKTNATDLNLKQRLAKKCHISGILNARTFVAG